ncbi:hypothetical protein [Saccharopolyspora erythraea]|uniref:hypothetical protein n=1 Tax=Saccharopolyspora erythraea TaxID=1836 RepID=UPI0020136207|nr:hypothetical protein [Saccharopolyspora erythraea]
MAMNARFIRTARGRRWGGQPPWTGGGRGGRRPPEAPSADDANAWFTGRLPEGWFTTAPEVSVDREEILVVGELPALDDDFADDAARAAAESGRIARFREETREERIEIARQAEHRYGRKVSWGARLGGAEELFTTLSAPVMTRLRQPERMVLDTLVDAGIARSRSEALAWAVRLVGEHTEEWLTELREALAKVDDLRAQGPDLT